MIRILFLWLALLSNTPAIAETRVPQSPVEMHLSLTPLVKQAAPAVVNIYARRVTEARPSPFQGDPFFGRYIEHFEPPQPRVQNSLGSGVVLPSDGIVVSNYHVVGMATDIRVVLADRSEFEARVLLGDEEGDLAIQHLDGAKDLPSLPLRDSDDVQVSELALAIGNPFGVGQTVSSGIISDLARSGGAGRGYFIQTDVPINQGKSGGALIDVQGNLIGVNTSILTRSGGSNGIGFAIPAKIVAAFVDQARAGETSFQHPWAGTGGQSVDADLAETLGRDDPDGIVISDFYLSLEATDVLVTDPGSIGPRVGPRHGDLVLAVNNASVFGPEDVRQALRRSGRTVSIETLRGTRRAALTFRR
jgi:S1-C subfamily serine protease